MTSETRAVNPVQSKMEIRQIAAYVAFVAVALVVIFILPRFISVSPAYSDSYLFAYSNRVGTLCLLFSLAVGGYYFRRLPLRFPKAAVSADVATGAVWTWTIIFAVACGVMYVFVRGLEGFGESAYLIDRMRLVGEGLKPYRDFEFAYGALLLYGPLSLTLLGLDPERSYFIFWLITVLAGVWILARTINMLDYPSEYKTRVFHLISLVALGFVLCTGLNYTLVRYLPATYFALLTQRMYTADSRRGHQAWAMAMTAGFTICVLLISPEMALAYAAGSLGYFAVFGWMDGSFARRQWVASFAGLAIAEVLIMGVANRLGAFATVKAFARGGYYFPIIPALHILLFFFCCGLTTLFVASRLRERSHGDGMLFVLAVSAGAIFAAMGRCDPGHVAFNGLGIVLVATVLASTRPSMWKIYQIVFVVAFVLIPMLTLVWTYRSLIKRAAEVRLFQMEPQGSMTKLDLRIEQVMRYKYGEPKAQMKFDRSKAASRMPNEIDLRSIYRGIDGTAEVPFGYRPAGFGSYQSSVIRSGYFYDVMNAFSPDSTKQKIGELESHRDSPLLLPQKFDLLCAVDPEAERHMISLLFAYPFHERPKHLESVREPLCEYIHINYQEKADSVAYGYSLWTRRPGR